MEDIKEVLIFIGYAFSQFLRHSLYYTVYFLLVLTVTISLYFLNYRFFDHFYPFIVYLVILILVNFWLKKSLFLKSQLQLNLLFIHYLENKGDLGRENLVGFLKKRSRINRKTVKESLKSGRLEFLSDKLRLAAAAFHLGITGDQAEAVGFPDDDRLNRLENLTLKYMLIESIIFLLLLIPFALISFLFTRGFAFRIQFLVYLLGVLFTYFLHTTIFDPLFYLILQKKFCEETA